MFYIKVLYLVSVLLTVNSQCFILLLEAQTFQILPVEKLYLEIDTKSRSTLWNSISQLSISHETISLKRVISKPKGGIENIDLQDADLCISRRKSSQDAFTLHNTDTDA